MELRPRGRGRGRRESLRSRDGNSGGRTGKLALTVRPSETGTGTSRWRAMRSRRSASSSMRSRLSASVFSFWRISDSSEPRNGAMATISLCSGMAFMGAAEVAISWEGAGASLAAMRLAASSAGDWLLTAGFTSASSTCEPTRWDGAATGGCADSTSGVRMSRVRISAAST